MNRKPIFPCLPEESLSLTLCRLRPASHSLSALLSRSPFPTGGAERMVNTKLTCLLLSQGKERRGWSKEKAQAVLSRCLLACSPVRKLAGLSVWGFLRSSPALCPEPVLSYPWSPAVPGSEQTPGKKVALPLWPGSLHGVRCVSLLPPLHSPGFCRRDQKP